MADSELARKIGKHGLRMRQRHAPVRQKGMVAHPVFTDYGQNTIEHLLDIDMSPDEIVKRMCTPESWQCDGKRGRAPEEAIEKAIRAKDAHTAYDSKSAKVANVMGLPPLAGTPKQIAWAQNIRSQHALRKPDSPHLREQTKAAWWIDNLRVL